MARKCTDSDVIGGLDARGFIFWSLVAKELWKPFVMLRKKWKLPWITKWVSYWLEYWKDNLEIQEWSIKEWQKVSLVDDLLATGWTIKAAIDLVKSLGWVINNLSFVISLDEKELTNLESRKKLDWYKIDTLVSYS
jgi:adenine phosphoribosyltransferase